MIGINISPATPIDAIFHTSTKQKVSAENLIYMRFESSIYYNIRCWRISSAILSIEIAAAAKKKKIYTNICLHTIPIASIPYIMLYISFSLIAFACATTNIYMKHKCKQFFSSGKEILPIGHPLNANTPQRCTMISSCLLCFRLIVQFITRKPFTEKKTCAHSHNHTNQ